MLIYYPKQRPMLNLKPRNKMLFLKRAWKTTKCWAGNLETKNQHSRVWRICSVETETIHSVWLEFVNLLAKGSKSGRERLRLSDQPVYLPYNSAKCLYTTEYTNSEQREKAKKFSFKTHYGYIQNKQNKIVQ